MSLKSNNQKSKRVQNPLPANPQTIKSKLEVLQEFYAIAPVKKRDEINSFLNEILADAGLYKHSVNLTETSPHLITKDLKILNFPVTYRQPINETINPEHCFCVQIADESLKSKGIKKMDVLICDTSQMPRDGDIAVIENLSLALRNSDRFIIRIVRFVGFRKVRLESANPSFKSFETEISNIRLLGRVVRIERDF